MLDRSLTYKLALIAEEGISNAERVFEHRLGRRVYEIRILRLIRMNPGITFTALALLTRFERTATSRMLKRLINADLVRRKNSTVDARQFSLTLTAKGVALCEKADPISLELEALMLEPLSIAERERFRAMLERMLDWVRTGYAEKVQTRFPEAAAEGRQRIAKSQIK